MEYQPLRRQNQSFGRMNEADLFERDLFGAGDPMWRSRQRRRRRGYGEAPGYGEAIDYGEAVDDVQESPQGTDDRVQVLARATNPSTTLFRKSVV